MSKASTSSLQHLLRQLYLAKPAASSIEGAAAAVISSGSSSAFDGGGTSSSRNGGASPFSTAAAARSLHGVVANDGPSGHQQQPGAHHHHHHAPLSASTSTAPGSSSGSSAKTRSHAHHYHRHNADHHRVASSSPSLLPSFWMQSAPSSGTTTPSTSSPPIPPFSSTPSTSSASSASNGAPANYTYSPATSSSNLTSAAPASSQHSDHYTGQPVSSLSNNTPNTDINDQQQQQNNNVSHSSLTLLPGAYGIPKRMSAMGGSPASNAKGKGKEVVDENESLQAQINQLRESMLSVQVGEDAYFVRHDALGVADGVGGWSGRKGADPGLFAARLMHHCSAELDLAERLSAKLLSTDGRDGNTLDNHENKKGGSRLAFVSSASSTLSSMDGQTDGAHGISKSRSANGEKEENGKSGKKMDLSPEHHNAADTNTPSIAPGDPVEILHRAWDQTLTEFFDMELIGSTTALIALLKDDELRLANIGDCCLSIIRGSDYIFRSQEQQHSFNYPFQIGTNSKDTPKKDSQFFNIKIMKGDLVILSSDGLVDNLFDEDILEEVQRYSTTENGGDGEHHSVNIDNDGSSTSKRVHLSPERLSKALCSRAKAVSEDQRAVTSPFQQRANEEGIHFVGGKHDDITVLVAVIGDKGDA